MSLWHILEHIISTIFPLRKESQYFSGWRTSDYRKRLPPPIQNQNSITALFSYKHKDVRTLIRSIKKEKVATIRDPLAELLADEILATYTDSAITTKTPVYIIPIPLSQKRLRERGFNQSGWIAQKIADNLGKGFVYAPYMLRKIRETKKQALLRRNDRLVNPAGSFRAQNVPTGAHIILIDDVATTGATVNEAKKVLRLAGAKKIEVFCIAH